MDKMEETNATPIIENSIESGHQHLVIDTLLAGAFAGLVRDSLLYPFEVYHVSRVLDVKFRWSMLFKGAMPTVIGAIPGAATLITTYSLIKVQLSPYFAYDRQYIVHMFAGFTAEVVSLLFKVPVDNVKKRHLTLSNQVSTYGITKRMTRTSGIAGLYRGFHPALFTRINSSLITLPLWENFMVKVKKSKKENELSPYEICMCGAVAGGLAGGITTPLYVARTYSTLRDIKEMDKEFVEKKELKRKAKELKEKPKFEPFLMRMSKRTKKSMESSKKFFEIIGEIYRTKGLRGLYRGCLARTAHITLGGALFFYCYAFLMAELQDDHRPKTPCTDVDSQAEKQRSECQTSGQSKQAKVLDEVKAWTERTTYKQPQDGSTTQKGLSKDISHPASEAYPKQGTDKETQMKEKTFERREITSSERTQIATGWFHREPKKTLDEDVKDDHIVNIKPADISPSAKSIGSTDKGIGEREKQQIEMEVKQETASQGEVSGKGWFYREPKKPLDEDVKGDHSINIKPTEINPSEIGPSAKRIGSTTKVISGQETQQLEEVKQETKSQGRKEWFSGEPSKPSNEASKHLENQTSPKVNQNPSEKIAKEKINSLENKAHQEKHIEQPLNRDKKST